MNASGVLTGPNGTRENETIGLYLSSATGMYLRDRGISLGYAGHGFNSIPQKEGTAANSCILELGGWIMVTKLGNRSEFWPKRECVVIRINFQSRGKREKGVERFGAILVGF